MDVSEMKNSHKLETRPTKASRTKEKVWNLRMNAVTASQKTANRTAFRERLSAVSLAASLSEDVIVVAVSPARTPLL